MIGAGTRMADLEMHKDVGEVSALEGVGASVQDGV